MGAEREELRWSRWLPRVDSALHASVRMVRTWERGAANDVMLVIPAEERQWDVPADVPSGVR